jgi:glycosyltransferase involved in cell wall biosynthesis
VVDEASSDATPLELARVRDDRLVVLRHDQPMGVATARDTGLARTDGEWVTFLDDDDVWAPDKLRTQIQAITDSPGADGRAQAPCGSMTGSASADRAGLRERGRG